MQKKRPHIGKCVGGRENTFRYFYVHFKRPLLCSTFRWADKQDMLYDQGPGGYGALVVSARKACISLGWDFKGRYELTKKEKDTTVYRYTMDEYSTATQQAGRRESDIFRVNF